jgi:TolA-binding protein
VSGCFVGAFAGTVTVGAAEAEAAVAGAADALAAAPSADVDTVAGAEAEGAVVAGVVGAVVGTADALGIADAAVGGCAGTFSMTHAVAAPARMKAIGNRDFAICMARECSGKTALCHKRARPALARAPIRVVHRGSPMHEVDDELQEIKREIIESRGLVIKTNNLTNALSADLKSIAKRQQSYESRLRWTSATAYIVFVVVVFAALKFAVDARVDAIEAKYLGLGKENARLNEEMTSFKDRERARATAEESAQKFYDLIRQNKKLEIVRGWDKIKDQPITKTEAAIFADAVERAKSDLAVQLYQEGQEKTKLQRWQEAATSFEESLKYNDTGAVAPAVRLALATAYRKLKRQRDAIPILTSLSEQTLDKEVQDDALYLLASCQEDLEAWNDAKTSWRTLLRKFPDTHWRNEATLHLQQLTTFH